MNAAQLFLAGGRKPQLGRVDVATRPEHRAEGPGHEVAPVVEVEMRDHDRLDVGPAFLFAQARQHSRSAVQEDASRAFDEVSGLCAPGVRPGRRAPDDREPHGLSVA